MRRSTIVATWVLLAACWARGGAPETGGASVGDPDAVQFFETRVRPLLVERCYSCHSVGAKKLKAELYVDSRQGLLKGGESGPAVVPGHPEQSRLMEAVRYANPDLQMPPKGKLSDQQVADLGEWVKRGAPWPEEKAGAGPVAGPSVPAFELQKRKAEHWAWQPIRSQQPPVVKDAAGATSAIDRFIGAKLEATGIQPAPPADRRTLIRRVNFDLTGLPPTPREVQAFVDDPSPDAFSTVVDRLLASPHFGERWARHWLDLVRYAETRGHEFDAAIPNAWQYRDYVVRAFNADVPYDQFVAEQLAGDLLEHPRLHPTEGFNESILGTGFWFLGEEVHSPVDIRQDEADRMNNRLDTMTKAFLGLTVGCARCHDHKFDAISNKDYYALTGVLLGSAYRQAPFESLEQNRKIAGQLHQLRTEARPALLKLAAEAQRPGIERTADYLLAAREVVLGAGAADSGPLDTKILSSWVTELGSARRDPLHPLHAFTTIALSRGVARPAVFDELLRSTVEGWQTRAEAPDGASPPVRVVADYTRADAPWWQDGFTFGVGPARAGEIDLSPAGVLPSLGIVPFSAARRDPAWPDLRSLSGERDAGALGNFDRPGRTFRTPKVTLQSGNIWYLVRGAGRVYAAVDSHLLISGPLHGALLKETKVPDDRWHWVRHDLSTYAGQRVEFEFTPAGDAPLAVMKVVESDRQPSDFDATGPLLLGALAGDSVHSIESLARAYQGLFAKVSSDIGADKILGSSDAPALAPLADWLLRHCDLFSAPDSPARRELTAAVREATAKQAALLKQVKAESHTAPAMLDGNGVDENVLIRGAAHNTGDLVPRRFLEALGGAAAPYPQETTGRLQLVRDMLSPENPFTSRVMVNRVWEHLLGTGIVPTVDNFGVLGQAPSHPELLDYLAETFRTQQGWSVKKLIRSIVLSKTYQMSSRPADAEQADPQNVLLHRMPVRRLEAEAIRDSILAVSGRLDRKVGGPSVEVYLTPFMDGRGRPAGSGPLDGDGRRSLYTKVRRNFLPPMMLAYDMPIPFATVGRRSLSNVPAQALILMNDPFVVQQADVWARRVLAQGNRSPEERIAEMYLEAFSRPPTDAELREGRAFLNQMGEMYGLKEDGRLDDQGVWADFGHVLFNVKEFIFLR